ncbi:LutB/LldF family L-lactate oxidation iron-sulfur protein [Rothia mucilaginosa]|jgi:iron-sulfur cluster-binding protein|uniref:Lactate utilization protein n=1 Tax=Rothia mucilaginosa TaxID=43675 RepID=A0A291DFY5_9MICC|nr:MULTISPECIES: LutB/LldF family L-lactate oxidation iron-sulfur protein [Rothia]ATF63406.1 lactate utilization protein [Rothia mucilaginosa]OFM22398.1 (4Fe-4S)-binding protein [Rothia sp. HMSC069D01]OFN72465.1 (4Fe-4S)-binding protein [Rothia sp. HMSC078H08]OFN73112.1 (4Fe-4S)-binding protein [Rothia sp. HMSC071B01]OFP76245.1 (4Fe-4S)-binding protein [Rothia sp. HMSC066G07]
MTAIQLGMPKVVHYGEGNIFEETPFPKYAKEELKNEQLRANLRFVTHAIRNKRARVTAEVPDWQDLRNTGESVKNYVLANLPELLEQFERNFTAAGGHVHWARNATEANQIALDLIREQGVDEIIKIKSMATAETGLNEFLEENGINAIETDLAEEIVQLGHDRPSHILVPAIHRNRREIRDIFLREIEGINPDITDEPAELAEASRNRLRNKFLNTTVAVSGTNFGIAETGTLTIVESEGNGRMCLTLPDTLITFMGIEKILPTFQDYEAFLQLLPRSSTGERMNPYTSMWTGVTPGDGPQNMHVILIDNGRTAVLSDELGRQALRCIRCSACMNVCPVYERAGGHAYGSTYPGPIGAILSPQLSGIEAAENNSLPYASSLCGACYEVCPVKINFPEVLVHLRAKDVESQHAVREFEGNKKAPFSQMDGMMLGAKKLFTSGKMMSIAERGLPMSRLISGRKHKITAVPGIVSGWTAYRDIPEPPKESFRNWWKKEKGQAPARDNAERVDIQALIEANKGKVAEAAANAKAAMDAQAAREAKENN